MVESLQKSQDVYCPEQKKQDQNVFYCNELSLKYRQRLIKCYVVVLLYGVKAWTLTDFACERVEAVYRRILKVMWMDHVTNAEVLRRITVRDSEVRENIKINKLSYFRHNVK